MAHIFKVRTGKNTVNYLDDYFFAALLKAACDAQVREFLDICKLIKFPVSIEKTYWGTTVLVFLGLLIDTAEQVVRIPKEKVDKALLLIKEIIMKKKATVLQIQKLCGTLNFLCKCVIPGRVFLNRTYSIIANPNLKQHHHVNINVENKLDLTVWKTFLENPNVFVRPFMDFDTVTSQEIDMYSDASGVLGFGAYCNVNWTYGLWPSEYLEKRNPSIDYLELFGLTVGVILWIHKFKNRSVMLFCDNTGMRDMVNANCGKNKNCMALLRLVIAECLVHNVRLKVKYVKSEHNGKADALSRNQLTRFRQLGPNMNEFPEPIPVEMWPPESIWVD